MKKLLVVVAIVLLLPIVAGGLALLLLDDPMRTLQSAAIRHADKLPLEYVGEKLFDKHCASCHDNPAMHAPTRLVLLSYFVFTASSS